MGLGLGQQRLVDRAAGGVGGMGDAPHRMAAFARQVQAERPVRVGRERHALADQPFDSAGAALGDEARGVLVDQPGAGVLRVAHMRLDAVVAAEHADDAALRPGRRRLVEVAFGQHHHGLLAAPGAAPRSGRPGRRR